MPRAFITIRQKPDYRWESFCTGLKHRGYTVAPVDPAKVKGLARDDVVVVWNMSARSRVAAQAAQAAGARLIVAENGYVSPDQHGRQYYSLALDAHNGAGRWRYGGGARWGRTGLTIAPWQNNPKGHFLVCDQRGIGSEEMRSPYGFGDHTAKKLRQKLSDRGLPNEVRVRPHPGRHAHVAALDKDLTGARAVVVWSSNVANIALLRGLPSVALSPYHVNTACWRHLGDILNPDTYRNPDAASDRLRGFNRLAWHQWHVKEIESGEPFRVLLGGDDQAAKMPWVGRSWDVVG